MNERYKPPSSVESPCWQFFHAELQTEHKTSKIKRKFFIFHLVPGDLLNSLLKLCIDGEQITNLIESYLNRKRTICCTLHVLFSGLLHELQTQGLLFLLLQSILGLHCIVLFSSLLANSFISYKYKSGYSGLTRVRYLTAPV